MKDFGTAAILCGGKSSRMGFDKCEVKVNGKLLIEIIAEKLEPIFENIILISNDKDKFKNIKYKVEQDIIPNSGPLGGIYTALKHTSSKYIFITACDMPVVNVNYIKYMIELIKSQKLKGVASYNSGYVEPLHSFYSTEMLSTFNDAINKNTYKLLNVMSSCNMYYIKDEIVREYSKNMSIFTNLNYKSDLSFLESAITEE